jgi:hypothetical protein
MVLCVCLYEEHMCLFTYLFTYLSVSFISMHYNVFPFFRTCHVPCSTQKLGDMLFAGISNFICTDLIRRQAVNTFIKHRLVL